MPKFIEWIGGSLLIVAIVYIIIQVVGALVLGPIWTHTYTKKDLIANYQAKKSAILAVKDYFASIVPPHKSVNIEFTDSHTLSRLDVSSLDSATGATIYPTFLQWDLSTSSPQVDSVLATLHWTEGMLEQLKHKLDLAFCISIGSGEPCRVGFQRSGMGMYFYELFSKPLPQPQRRLQQWLHVYYLQPDCGPGIWRRSHWAAMFSEGVNLRRRFTL